MENFETIARGKFRGRVLLQFREHVVFRLGILFGATLRHVRIH